MIFTELFPSGVGYTLNRMQFKYAKEHGKSCNEVINVRILMPGNFEIWQKCVKVPFN